MRKWLLTFGAFLFLILLNVQTSLGEDGRRGFYVEPQISGAISRESALGDSAYYGGRLGYRFGCISLDVESGYARFEDESGFGDISIVPLLANLRYHPLSVTTWDPYFIFGLGALFTDLHPEKEIYSDLIADLSSISVSGDIDDTIAGQVGIGTLYHFTDHISGFLEIRVLFAFTDAETTVFEGNVPVAFAIGDDIDLRTFFLGGGIRIRI